MAKKQKIKAVKAWARVRVDGSIDGDSVFTNPSFGDSHRQGDLYIHSHFSRLIL